LKEKQKDEEILQLRNELSEKSSLFETKREELEQLKRDHEDEIERISSQLDASAGKLQKVQVISLFFSLLTSS
jgi:predicted  nucleic acid-binding Zn-ribbon protein